MKTSPIFSGILYSIMGSLFLSLAIQSAQETTIWNFFTLVLMIVATFDFFVALRCFILYKQIKKK